MNVFPSRCKMSYSPLEQRLIEKAFQYLPRCEGRLRHISFLVKRNKIIATGWNLNSRTHKLSRLYGYWDAALHSEICAVVNLKRPYRTLRNFDLYNVKINRYNEVRLSRPCWRCQRALQHLGIKRVFYTDDEGNFQLEILEPLGAPKNLSAKVI